MKKILTATLTLAALAASANATLIFDYQFETDGKKLSLVTDNTGNGHVWNGTFKSGGPNILTAGNVYDMANPDKATKKVLALGLTSGIVTLEVGFSDWAMDNTANKDNLSFKLDGGSGSISSTWGAQDSASIRLRTAGDNGGGGDADKGGSNETINAINGTSLKLQIIADLDAGTYTSSYDLGDGNGWIDNTGTNGANGITSLVDVNFSVGTLANDGTSGAINQWATEGNADHAEIDYITLDVVPEPSSTALLGLGGLALMLRRRR